MNINSVDPVHSNPPPEKVTQNGATGSLGVSPDSKPKQSAPENSSAATVQISNAAQKLFQESTETAAQTAKEANNGDVQAQRLLAKEASQKAMEQGTDA